MEARNPIKEGLVDGEVSLVVDGDQNNACTSIELEGKIVVFVNSKSGGQLGRKLMTPLGKIFGEAMVVDLLHSEPYGAKTTLELLVDEKNLRILICGGDGTVQWVLADIDELVQEGKITQRPAVAILPLGTGNDLSRQFGWGHGFGNHLFKDLKESVQSGTIISLDRWDVEVSSASTDTAATSPGQITKKCTMSNYFGVGLDAKIVNNFEGCR